MVVQQAIGIADGATVGVQEAITVVVMLLLLPMQDGIDDFLFPKLLAHRSEPSQRLPQQRQHQQNGMETSSRHGTDYTQPLNPPLGATC